VVFHTLTEADLTKIVEIQLGNLRKRLAERKVSLTLTDAAKEHIVRAGYDPAYGARPLKRAIQKEVETPLARLLLKGEVPDGGSVTADYDGAHDALTFVAKPGSAG
jgi:ATP-dependent Clp protease ATP-binding subunit ClpB